MEFRKSRDHVLLPIFYGVDKYDVRNQEFSFGETFQYLIQRISPSEDEVSRWRTVLSEAGGIYGFDVPDHIESSREAFKQASPEEHFIDLSRRMVDYTAGLPLAIKVLGCFLFGQSLMEWKSASKKLGSSYSDQRMYNILRLRYDSLDFREQEIFITLVGIYIGEDMNDVIQKLDGSGCNASTGIKVLMDRSLVTIDNNNKLRTHYLLQDMARKIIREISQNKLQNRGIVVFKDDVELPRGNYIKTKLIQAIGSSKIAILIFSKEYARSKWCLEELSLIMEFHKSNQQVVLPVFNDVDPLEIHNQTFSFGEAFQYLIQRISPSEDEVSRWRTALSEAGGIYGFDVGDHMEFK
ncbi:hypothetical protein K1719_036350 [Acacia pycnantha]|nr:hypothetical protein K1719_036350 [Acacia pycnantha]